MATDARVVVEAEGLVVAPGFVDFHSHSDVSLLADPRAESAIRQGITTQLVGNCGFSAAPMGVEKRASYRRDGLMFSHDGYDWDWSSMAEYRQRLKHAAPAINLLTLVGHTTLRVAVLGQADRPASAADLALMCQLLERALDDGAVGLSSGLTYTPGCYAPTAELTTLVDVLGGSGLGYHTHMRNYSAGLPTALNEALEITDHASVPAFISHLYPAGREQWGTARQILRLLEAARERGSEVCFDVTPWLRGGGPMSQYVPGWARAGGTSDLLAGPMSSSCGSAWLRTASGSAGALPNWPARAGSRLRTRPWRCLRKTMGKSGWRRPRSRPWTLTSCYRIRSAFRLPTASPWRSTGRLVDRRCRNHSGRFPVSSATMCASEGCCRWRRRYTR